jgi:hypothetical protein
MDRYLVSKKLSFFFISALKLHFLGIKIFHNFFEMLLVPGTIPSKKNSGRARFQIGSLLNNISLDKLLPPKNLKNL